MKLQIVLLLSVVATSMGYVHIEPEQIPIWFRLIDADGDGIVTRKELGDYKEVYQRKCSWPERPVSETLKVTDANGDGIVTIEEFLQTLAKGTVPEYEALGYFKLSDPNRDGVLTAAEYRQGIQDGRQQCHLFSYLADFERSQELECLEERGGNLDLVGLKACIAELGGRTCEPIGGPRILPVYAPQYLNSQTQFLYGY